MTDAPSLDVIVVSHGHARFMDALFASLARVSYPRDRWRVHVVINKDEDGTREAVCRAMAIHAAELPEVAIHEPHANLGFSGGNNLAIDQAIRRESAFVFLLNPDTRVEPEAFAEAVRVARSDERIGSVQSLLLRADRPDEVNSWGNAIHFMGFGYCGGDHAPRSSAPTEPREIAYASGAAVLIPVPVLQDIGRLDEVLFAYHEDLDLGWRIMLSGRKNVIAPASVVFHDYDFSRSIAKWEWMERNRLIVVLKNYRLATILFLAPALVATETAIWAFAAKGGWLLPKLRASLWFLKPSSWAYLASGRAKIRAIRRVPDWVVFKRFTCRIVYQELRSGWAERIANPFWCLLYMGYRSILRW